MQPLVSGLEMAELDRRTMAELGIPGRVLMETAGRAVAETAHALLDGPSEIAVVCGPGNNGGDGYVAAMALAARGHRVRVFLFSERARVKGDAKAALATLEKLGEIPVLVAHDAKALWQFADHLRGCDLAIDALLGTGVNRDVSSPIGEAIDVLNDAGVPVVAVDIASGVDADTGHIWGRAVHAQHTVTFGFPKRGHYLHPGAEARGSLRVVDIGVPDALAHALPVMGKLVGEHDGPTFIPARRGDVHKGTFGHLAVIAGSPRSPGAAILALTGALRAGVGLVSWVTDPRTLAHAPSRPPEVMLRVRGDDLAGFARPALEGASAAVIGPGLSTEPETSAWISALLPHAEVPLCLDADALNLMAEEPRLWASVRAPVVVTPHPKEMSRLLGSSVHDVQRDRFAAALQLAVARKCVVVLKGAGTVVASPDGSVAVIDAGSPALASGGTGDVLAGVIGALLAQGLDPVSAALGGALLHGKAGEAAAARASVAGTCASDVLDAIREVLRRWQR